VGRSDFVTYGHGVLLGFWFGQKKCPQTKGHAGVAVKVKGLLWLRFAEIAVPQQGG
jgi:hypothetical protein